MGLPKLLITGANGTIGAVLQKGLANSFQIFCVDRTAANSERSFVADLADYDQFAAVLNEIRPIPCLVHLAADPHVDAPWESVLKNNIIATRNVYEAARENGVSRIVFASSNHTTGGYKDIPPARHEQEAGPLITVRDPVRPDSDYGVSKVFGEALARSYYDRFGIESICLRIGSVLDDDDPTADPWHQKSWLSHHDLVQLVYKSILADVPFGIYYGVSDNQGRFWDIENATQEIGYSPQDDASQR